jgi:hypothetical protein
MKAFDLITGDRVPVLVYDVSIENLEDRKKAVVSYDTIKQASQALGLSYNVIKSSITSRKRVYSPMLKKDVAVRLKPKK